MDQIDKDLINIIQDVKKDFQDQAVKARTRGDSQSVQDAESKIDACDKIIRKIKERNK